MGCGFVTVDLSRSNRVAAFNMDYVVTCNSGQSYFENDSFENLRTRRSGGGMSFGLRMPHRTMSYGGGVTTDAIVSIKGKITRQGKGSGAFSVSFPVVVDGTTVDNCTTQSIRWRTKALKTPRR